MMNPQSEDIWGGQYKIPWNDPAFSRRMLREHLSQDHDLASRRVEWIDKQVTWIHQELLQGRPSRVLDLGCGPGLYSHRLAKLGHRCLGIDFGPASIDYAEKHNPEPRIVVLQCSDEDVLGFRFWHKPFQDTYRSATLLAVTIKQRGNVT